MRSNLHLLTPLAAALAFAVPSVSQSAGHDHGSMTTRASRIRNGIGPPSGSGPK